MSTLFISVKELRKLIVEEWYLEKYSKSLEDDESFKKDSYLIPKERKDQIIKFLNGLGMNKKRKKKRKRSG